MYAELAVVQQGGPIISPPVTKVELVDVNSLSISHDSSRCGYDVGCRFYQIAVSTLCILLNNDSKEQNRRKSGRVRRVKSELWLC